MNRCVVCLLVLLAVLLCASLALAEGIVAEVYRSPHGWPGDFAADPSDGSCWAISGTSVVHLDAESNLVYQYVRAARPTALAVDVIDGSCWVADTGTWDGTNYVGSAVIRLSRDGGELCRAEYWADSLSVNPRDESLWLVSRTDLSTPAVLVHLSATGEELGAITAAGNPGRVAVSALDGTLWAWDMGDTSAVLPSWRLVHLAADGAVVGEWPGFGYTLSIDSADGSCWAGGYDTDVIHLSADNEVLSSHAGCWWPTDIVVNPADGSCWVQFLPSDGTADCGQVLVLLGADGAEVRRLSPPLRWLVGVLAVSPADGSLWTGTAAGWVHLAADGTVLQQRRGLQRPYAVAVDPDDGGYWIGGGCGAPWIARYDALGNELWRKTGFIAPNDIAPDPVDGSIWVADMVSVTHFAADGTQLPFSATYGTSGPNHVMVDPRDRSIWVSDTDQIKHYGTDGALLKTITYNGLIYDCQLAPDGSLWGLGIQDVPPYGHAEGMLVHISAGGAVSAVGGIVRLLSFSVNPVDGSVWTADFGTHEGSEPGNPPRRVTHLAANGSVLWQGGEAYDANQVAVDPRTGNCWAVGDGGPAYLLSPSGEELGHTEQSYVTFSVAVSPADGTLWLLDERNQLCKVASTGPFSDIAATSWAAPAISACTAADVVRGYDDGSYHPEDQVTRDQMAVYLARALCGSDADVPEGPASPSFGDVAPDFWAYKQIEYCRAQNIVQGDDGSYQPEVALDRAQMATFLARSMVPLADRPDLASYSAPSSPSFADVASDFWAYKPIEYARLRYVAAGYPDGNYHPEAACTRDQMAVFMARAFHLFQ